MCGPTGAPRSGSPPAAVRCATRPSALGAHRSLSHSTTVKYSTLSSTQRGSSPSAEASHPPQARRWWRWRWRPGRSGATGGSSLPLTRSPASTFMGLCRARRSARQQCRCSTSARRALRLRSHPRLASSSMLGCAMASSLALRWIARREPSLTLAFASSAQHPCASCTSGSVAITTQHSLLSPHVPGCAATTPGSNSSNSNNITTWHHSHTLLLSQQHHLPHKGINNNNRDR